jgi:hypothetical protein
MGKRAVASSLASSLGIKNTGQHEDIHHHANKDETDENLEREHVPSSNRSSCPRTAAGKGSACSLEG